MARLLDSRGFFTAGLRRLDPERAHRLAVRASQLKFGGRMRAVDPILANEVFGLKFANPVGLAAGFDKSAEAWSSLLRLGAGFVEVGTLTPLPQVGNPKPRVFRLPEDKAVINRYGFNNDGLKTGLARLRSRGLGVGARARTKARKGIVGINLGINKDCDDPARDYAQSVAAATPYADYLVINVSSPNTPGLRDLQAASRLETLLAAIVVARDGASPPDARPPILVKIAPDMTRGEVEECVEVAIRCGAAGLIVANTTISRPPSLKSHHAGEAGGLSGAPLAAMSTRQVAWAYLAARGRVQIIGVGGIDGPERAYEKIRAGADLVQVYTALTYSGVGLFRQITDGLAALLHRDGFTSISAAVGIDAAACAEAGEE